LQLGSVEEYSLFWAIHVACLRWEFVYTTIAAAVYRIENMGAAKYSPEATKLSANGPAMIQN
jgi:hypothetical protein